MRRPPALVLADEVVDDVLLELALEVLDVVRGADDLTHAPRVVDVLHRAASLAQRGEVVALLCPEPHCDADDVVALALQQQRGDGGVDPSAHGDDYTALAHTESLSQRPSGVQSISRCLSRANDAGGRSVIVLTARLGYGLPETYRSLRPLDEYVPGAWALARPGRSADGHGARDLSHPMLAGPVHSSYAGDTRVSLSCHGLSPPLRTCEV